MKRHTFRHTQKSLYLQLIKNQKIKKNGSSPAKGEGSIAEMIHKTIEIGRNKYFKDRKIAELSAAHFSGSKTQQLKLF